MKNDLFAFTLFAVACAHDPEPNVTLPPQASASASASDAGPDADVDVATALGAFKAAEALQRDGTKAEARAAFQDVMRKFRYSRWGREAELRVAQIDDSPDELRQWAHDHRSDERSTGILAKLDTVGDVTCRVDADCAVTTKRDCCECCPRRALATSRKWLEWRDKTQCLAARCAGCEESCKPEDGLHAACAEAKCMLVR